MSIKELAINGGEPVRSSPLPYGRQWVDDVGIASIVQVLQSDWLTTGPSVAEFEHDFANFVGAKEAVALNSGTAALHAAMHALKIGKGDEVIVPTMTFSASANCILYLGGTPSFVDVDPDTLLIDPVQIEAKLTARTKAIVAVDYTGQPCDYDVLNSICNSNHLFLISDACHALGGSFKRKKVGTLADLSTFSFHPVKHITTGEGGMVTTDNSEFAQRMRSFRNHGITSDHRQREQSGSWFYEMVDLGFNYRLTDIQCALGISQIPKLSSWVSRRREIARRYQVAFNSITAVEPLVVREPDAFHAYHLFVIRLNLDQLQVDRAQIYAALHAEGIGVNVHYIPVHLHPFYQKKLGTKPGDYPIAEAAYERILSLPIFPRMSDRDIEDVIEAVIKVCKAYCIA